MEMHSAIALDERTLYISLYTVFWQGFERGIFFKRVLSLYFSPFSLVRRLR